MDGFHSSTRIANAPDMECLCKHVIVLEKVAEHRERNVVLRKRSFLIVKIRVLCGRNAIPQ